MAKYTFSRALVKAAIEAAGGLGAVEKRTGLSHQTVGYWIRGVADPRASSLARLASGLGVSPAAFFLER